MPEYMWRRPKNASLACHDEPAYPWAIQARQIDGEIHTNGRPPTGIRADFPMGLRVRCTLTKRRRPKYEKLPDRHFPRGVLRVTFGRAAAATPHCGEHEELWGGGLPLRHTCDTSGVAVLPGSD